jgi:hypothetical protein
MRAARRPRTAPSRRCRRCRIRGRRVQVRGDGEVGVGRRQVAGRVVVQDERARLGVARRREHGAAVAPGDDPRLDDTRHPRRHEADLVAAGPRDLGADARRGTRLEPDPASRLERLLLRRREQHVVQDEPVPRRMRVHAQVGGQRRRSGAADPPGRARRGTSTCPRRTCRGCTSTHAALLLRQHQTPGFSRSAGSWWSGRRSRQHVLVVLHQHRGTGSNFAAELEQRERAERLAPRRVHLVTVDVAERIDAGFICSSASRNASVRSHCSFAVASGSMGVPLLNGARCPRPWRPGRAPASRWPCTWRTGSRPAPRTAASPRRRPSSARARSGG